MKLASKLLSVAAVTTALLAGGQFAGRSRAQSVPAAPANPPATRPADPAAADWAVVDAALRARLGRVGVAASPDADRVTVLRRLALDATGRPPTTEETRVFLADPSPGAERRLLDVLVAVGGENADRAKLADWVNAGAGPTTAPTTGPASDLAASLALTAGDVAVRQKVAELQYERAYVDAARQWNVAFQALSAEPKVKAAYMGVGVDVPNDTLRAQLKLPEGSGLVVNYVDADGPSKDLIRKHDVLQKLDDQVLIDGAQLVTLVRMRKAGETVPVTVIREARPVTVQVKLAEKDLPPLSTYLSDARAAAGDAKAAVTAPAEMGVEAYPLATFDPDHPGILRLRAAPAPGTPTPTWAQPVTPPPSPAGGPYTPVAPPPPAPPSPQSILWGVGGGDVVSAAVRTGALVGTTDRPVDVVYFFQGRPVGDLTAVDAGTGMVLRQAAAAGAAPAAATPSTPTTQPRGGASR